MSPIFGISFIALVAILYFVLILGIFFANIRLPENKRAYVYIFRLLFGGWLLLTGLLGLQGFILDFSGTPPRIALAAFVAVVGAKPTEEDLCGPSYDSNGVFSFCLVARIRGASSFCSSYSFDQKGTSGHHGCI